MGFALLLTVLMAVTTYRVKSLKMLLITLGFLAFFVKGLLLTLGIFLSTFNRAFHANPEMILVDFVILVLLYAGLVKGS
jgi:ABC-type dipeptide/oligopeptide/nickel transport system permease subunit